MKWKIIENYPNYSVSDTGLIKRNNKLLKPWLGSRGYLYVSLSKNGKVKKFSVHRLVANAFLSKNSNALEVNHLDENKKNNCVSNLEWTTHKKNLNYGTHNSRMARTKISQKLGKPVIQFDKNGNYLKRWNSAQECGRNGFIWKYESEVISND